jgi:nicotinate-nucleotide adenylyltransferase
VDETEIERGGISYTVDTVRELAARHAGASLHFIIGSDSLEELHTWREIRTIAGMVRFITVRRDATLPAPSHPELERRLHGRRLLNLVLNIPPLPISSTEIRHCVRRGQPISDQVHPAVADYIAREGLYR